MSTPVGNVSNSRGVQTVDAAPGAAASAAPDATAVLPAPTTEMSAAAPDVMALLYALTSKQRDTDAHGRKQTVERKSVERKDAVEHEKEEIRKAQEAKDDGGWLSSITDFLGTAADTVVGGSPLEDIAHGLSKATGCKVFDIAYDFIRPDALLHAAIALASAASGSKGVQEVGDAKPWEGAPQGTSTSMMGNGTSLKTRSQGVADATDTPEVMDGYAVTRDCVAGAMLTVGTCGTGTVAVVAVATSAAIMIEAKADLLGKAGVGAKEAMWIRLGAQAALIVVSAGASFSAAAPAASGGAQATKAAQVAQAVKAAQAAKAAQTVKAASLVVNGTTQVARGTVQVGQAVYAKASDDHMTEAAKVHGMQKHIDREQQLVIDGLREVSKSYQRTLETIAGTMNERDQTPLMLARHIA